MASPEKTLERIKARDEQVQSAAHLYWEQHTKTLQEAGKSVKSCYWGLHSTPVGNTGISTMYVLEDGIAVAKDDQIILVVKFSDIKTVYNTDTYMQFYAAGEWFTISSYHNFVSTNFKPAEFAKWLEYVIAN